MGEVKRDCPKCGGQKANICYKGKGEKTYSNKDNRAYVDFGSYVIKEHLSLRCLQCGYDWIEDVKGEKSCAKKKKFSRPRMRG